MLVSSVVPSYCNLFSLIQSHGTHIFSIPLVPEQAFKGILISPSALKSRIAEEDCE